MAIAAPVIVAEMNDWVKLGGGNSGIVGDRNHSYGFHLAANQVPASDYSRWRDPNGADGPYVDWSYACAGDFRHGGDERLRAMHRRVLARLMAGQLPMICEFIGQPWPDRPVYYWARWNGSGTLQRYTGAGHDLWSHISWYRSRVDERAWLWKEGTLMALTDAQQEDLYRRVCNIDSFIYYGEVKGQQSVPADQVRLGWGVGAPPQADVPHALMREVAELRAKVEAVSAPTAEVVKAALLQALADPQVKAALAQAAFEGAQRAERE